MKKNEEIVRQAMSELGKRSAASPLRTKEYYRDLGKRSGISKRKKKEQIEKHPSTIIYNILSGKS